MTCTGDSAGLATPFTTGYLPIIVLSGNLHSLRTGASRIITRRSQNLLKFGIYYYPWYNKTRWAEAPRVGTPTLGEYDSTDPTVVKTQMDLIIDCGFDYVIFELVPTTDWCFETVDRSIDIAISHLRSQGIKWSFLLDAFVVSDHEKEDEEAGALVRHIEGRRWCDGLISGKNNLPLLFVFFPYPEHAHRIVAEHGGEYEFRFPAYMPHWGKIDETYSRFFMPPWSTYLSYAKTKEEGKSLADIFIKEGYISFFETTESRNNFDGFASVIPSYNDRKLKRDTSVVPALPIIYPDNGETLRSYFEKALATGAEHIIVYGWNEYFEGATIEPTEEYGTDHVEICKEAITRAKGNSPI